MYETRQNKALTSRTLSSPERKCEQADNIKKSFANMHIPLALQFYKPMQCKAFIGWAEQLLTPEQDVSHSGTMIRPQNKEEVDALNDQFNRHYLNEQEFHDHFSMKPVSCGLIKRLALWYRIPYFGRQFFVLGESHNAVRGIDIAKESNISPDRVFYEGYSPSWDGVKNQPISNSSLLVGPDEIHLKLLDAINIYKGFLELQNEESDQGESIDTPVTQIPQNKTFTRETYDGSYKLIIKNTDNENMFWENPEQSASPTPHEGYNPKKQALNGMNQLIGEVFTTSTARNLQKRFYKLQGILHKCFFSPDLSIEKQEKNIEKDDLKYIIAVLISYLNKKGVIEESRYVNIGKNRSIFMLKTINDASRTTNFDFAAIGNNHLNDMKGQLKSIPYITMEDFYNVPIGLVAIN